MSNVHRILTTVGIVAGLCAPSAGLFAAPSSLTQSQPQNAGDAAPSQTPITPSTPSPAITPSAPVSLLDQKDFQARISKAASIAVARVAQYDLRLGGGPEQRDYWLAAELLQMASDLSPDDPDILRLLIEARAEAGDSASTVLLTRQLLKLDPADTVAQLRVISAEISGRNQSVEQRLASYDRFLGKDGERFDPAIRSRLALDAALLAREQGDMDGFASRLAKATELDCTNKDAATLALNFFSEQVPDAAGRLELLLNVLKADPFDPETHLGIARECSHNGAFASSARFFSSYQQLCDILGQRPDDIASNEAQVLDWMLNGAEDFVRRMNESIASARESVMRARDEAKASGVEADKLPDPLSQRLTTDGERLRVLASAALGKRDLIEHAIREMQETIDRTVAELYDLRTRQKTGVTEDAAKEIARVLKQESAWLRLWAGVELDKASRDFQELRSNPATEARDIKRMDAWFKLRYGELDAAEAELRDLGNEPLGRIGLAVLAELRGKQADAIDQYIDIAQSVPGSPAGAYATTRAKVLIESTGSKKTVAVPAVAKKLSAIVDNVPKWLEEMFANPLEFMTLRVELEGVPSGRVSMFDKLAMTVRLRNVSRFPLAVGPDKPLNSRLLLVPTVRMNSDTIRRAGMHAVASIDRRLRLMPREEMTITIWPDNGFVGLTMQEDLRASMSVRWRILQGFRAMRGLFEEGPMCLTTDVGTLVRPASAMVFSTVDDFKRTISTGNAMEVCEAALAFRDRVGTGAEETRMSQTDAEGILDEILRRFSTMDRSSKMLLVSCLPTSVAMTAMAKFDDLVSRDNDPMVVRFAMIARTASVDAPLLRETTWVENEQFAETARVLRERLLDNKRTYARPQLPEDLLDSHDGDSGASADGGAPSRP